MAWSCSHCSETIDGDFAVCWKCGAGRDGTVDPDFHHADVYQPAIAGDKNRFGLRELFWLTASCSVMLAFFRGAHTGLPEGVVMALGIVSAGAGMILLLRLFVWLMTSSTQVWQRSNRDDKDPSTKL